MVEDISFPSKIVIDASVALAFLLPDEKRPEFDILFNKISEGRIRVFIPAFFYFEVFNGAKSAVIRKRVSRDKVKKVLKRFLKFRIIQKEIDWFKTFNLSLKHNLSFYDASYLSLAKQEKIPLLTLDKLLLKKS